MHKKFGLLTFQIRLKRNLPRRSFWGIVLVTLLCLNLSRVRKEYLLQRRFCRQNNPWAVPERPSWMVYCLSSPHMQISCLEKHLQLQTAPLCVTSALLFLPSSMGCAKSVLQSRPCLQIRDFKGRRHHWDYPSCYPGSCPALHIPQFAASDPDISTRKQGLQWQHVLESLDGQDEPNMIQIQLSRSQLSGLDYSLSLLQQSVEKRRCFCNDFSASQILVVCLTTNIFGILDHYFSMNAIFEMAKRRPESPASHRSRF